MEYLVQNTNEIKLHWDDESVYNFDVLPDWTEQFGKLENILI